MKIKIISRPLNFKFNVFGLRHLAIIDNKRIYEVGLNMKHTKSYTKYCLKNNLCEIKEIEVNRKNFKKALKEMIGESYSIYSNNCHSFAKNVLIKTEPNIFRTLSISLLGELK